MFFRLSDRFQWTPKQIGDLNSFQIKNYLDQIADTPLPIVAMADIPKSNRKRRR
jgi:hypothetical protein